MEYGREIERGREKEGRASDVNRDHAMADLPV